MTRISNVDQALLLLRQQLQRMSETERSRKSGKARAPASSGREAAATRIEAVARTNDLSDEDLARALLGALMADEFGDAAANDHKFQRMVDEVHRIIASDAKARILLDNTVKEIRASD